MLTDMFAQPKISVMELTTRQIAEQANRSERFVQLALRSGDLPTLRTVGRTAIVDDIAATAWRRRLARGRHWTAEVRDAALDLLSRGETGRLSSSERSRLRARLRVMDASAIAHAAGGQRTGWARYRVELVPDLPRIGPSAIDPAQLGIVRGEGWVTFVESDDLDRLELDHDVTLDADGNMGVVERAAPDTRAARLLLDAYLLGDARLSAAAAAELEGRAHAL